jgi:hypothetical protein
MLSSFRSDVIDRVDHDVVDVVVGDGVDNLSTPTLPLQEVGSAQNAKVLGDEGLRGAGGFDEFVHALWALGHGDEQGKTQRVRHGLQQLSSLSERCVCMIGGGRRGHPHIVTSLYGNVYLYLRIQWSPPETGMVAIEAPCRSTPVINSVMRCAARWAPQRLPAAGPKAVVDMRPIT